MNQLTRLQPTITGPGYSNSFNVANSYNTTYRISGGRALR